MSESSDNVVTLPTTHDRSPVMALVDVLNRAKVGDVEDVLIITRDAQGYLDIEASNLGTACMAEMALYLNANATEFVDQMNAIEDEPCSEDS